MILFRERREKSRKRVTDLRRGVEGDINPHPKTSDGHGICEQLNSSVDPE